MKTDPVTALPPPPQGRRFQLSISLGFLLIIQIISLALSASILGLTSSLISWTNSSMNERAYALAYLTNATINLALQPTEFRRVGMWLLFAVGLGGTIDAILILFLGVWCQRKTDTREAETKAYEMYKHGFGGRFDSSNGPLSSPVSSNIQPSINSGETLVVVTQDKRSKRSLRIILYVMSFISTVAVIRSVISVVMAWIEYYNSSRVIGGSVIRNPFGDGYGLSLFRIVSSQYTPESWVCGLAKITRGVSSPVGGSLGGMCRQATAARVLALPLILLDIVRLVTVVWMLF